MRSVVAEELAGGVVKVGRKVPRAHMDEAPEEVGRLRTMRAIKDFLFEVCCSSHRAKSVGTLHFSCLSVFGPWNRKLMKAQCPSMQCVYVPCPWSSRVSVIGKRIGRHVNSRFDVDIMFD